MEPFKQLDVEPDPDWLQQIAAGKTYVYPDFQRDKYGTFLSGHAPIYDSQGRYSGFVGVDFDLQYYLAQEASFRAISIGTLTGAVLLALLIGYVAARYHFDLNDRIEQQYRASIRDELTKLLNRRGALTAVSEALAVRASTYATILVDVDDLKGINDNYGHVDRRRVAGERRRSDSRKRARERHLRALRRRRVPDLRGGLRPGRRHGDRAAHPRGASGRCRCGSASRSASTSRR